MKGPTGPRPQQERIGQDSAWRSRPSPAVRAKDGHCEGRGHAGPAGPAGLILSCLSKCREARPAWDAESGICTPGKGLVASHRCLVSWGSRQDSKNRGVPAPRSLPCRAAKAEDQDGLTGVGDTCSDTLPTVTLGTGGFQGLEDSRCALCCECPSPGASRAREGPTLSGISCVVACRHRGSTSAGMGAPLGTQEGAKGSWQ